MPSVVNHGTRIHYEVSGTGPPIVLGHSFLCSGAMWAPQVAALSGQRTLVNVDLRGHGESGSVEGPFEFEDLVEDALAVLDALGMQRVLWAGLSIGGMVALRAALTAPDRVSGLVLLDTDAGAETPWRRFEYQVMTGLAGVVGTGPLLPRIARKFFCQHTRQTRPELVEEWKARFGLVPFATIRHTADVLTGRAAILDRLGAVEVPALVVVGEFDAATPPPRARRIAHALCDASLTVIENAGHLSTLEQPEAVNAALAAFLQAHPV